MLGRSREEWLCLPKIPFSGFHRFHPCNIVLLESLFDPRRSRANARRASDSLASATNRREALGHFCRQQQSSAAAIAERRNQEEGKKADAKCLRCELERISGVDLTRIFFVLAEAVRPRIVCMQSKEVRSPTKDVFSNRDWSLLRIDSASFDKRGVSC